MSMCVLEKLHYLANLRVALIGVKVKSHFMALRMRTQQQQANVIANAHTNASSPGDQHRPMSDSASARKEKDRRKSQSRKSMRKQ